jgi:hypothetical protein
MSDKTKTDKAQAKGEKKEKLPKAPRDPNKVVKPWIGKRQDNAMRALRALSTLKERFGSAAGEGRDEFQEETRNARESIKAAVQFVEATVASIAKLQQGHYKPLSEKVKLEAGVLVWIKGGVWRKKFAGLYKPEEMEGLKVVALASDGKIVRARTASGEVQIVEPVGVFKTTPVDYVKAMEEKEEESAAA